MANLYHWTELVVIQIGLPAVSLTWKHKIMSRANPPQPSATDLAWRWFLAIISALALLIGLVQSKGHRDRPGLVQANATPPYEPARADSTPQRNFRPRSAPPAQTAEEVVLGKLAQFSRSRREFAYALARKHNVEVPADVETFFAAVESGEWERIEAAFEKINGHDSSAGQAERPPGVAQLWPAILDAYGAAEQVHLWPAQQLLDYGNAVLGALRPGMIYVGGTDNGRWIPELLNDTSGGEQHIILTQNGLADASYLDYLRLQYEGRLGVLSAEESQRAFQDYVADAQKRLAHDEQFPDEPKQIRPGEDVRMSDGKIAVGGQVAVMAINERLLQLLMQNNPGISFALEESFPLKGTYGDALPLGPLMELRAQDGPNAFTAERATESLEYWRNLAQQVLAQPEAPASDAALKSYSHDADAAANLLAAHNFTAEAEQAYRLGMQLWPGNPESVGRLADLLTSAGRETEARVLLQDFSKNHPNEQKDLERVSAAWHFLWSAKAPGP
jgi:hypothetical protein